MVYEPIVYSLKNHSQGTKLLFIIKKVKTNFYIMLNMPFFVAPKTIKNQSC